MEIFIFGDFNENLQIWVKISKKNGRFSQYFPTSIARHSTEHEEDAGEEVYDQGVDTFRVGDFRGDVIEGVNQHEKESDKEIQP